MDDEEMTCLRQEFVHVGSSPVVRHLRGAYIQQMQCPGKENTHYQITKTFLKDMWVFPKIGVPQNGW